MTQPAMPLYLQIAEQLKSNIRSGFWPEGTRLPTEMELCDQFHVSRITIRKALEELVHENLLIRKRAVGTFVNNYSPDKTSHMTRLKSTVSELLEQGKTLTTRCAQVSKIAADHKLAAHLHLYPGEDVLLLKRLRGFNDDFLAYFMTYVPYRSDFSLDHKTYYGSFYDYLNFFDIYPSSDSEYVEAISANKELQTRLELESPVPILKRVRFTSDLDAEFYEYTECYYVGKDYKYYLDFTD